MQEVAAFDRAALEYDRWFEDHPLWYSSELADLKMAVPNTGSGIEFGVGTGRFAKELGIKTGVAPSKIMASIAFGRNIKVLGGYAVANASFDFTLMVTVDCFLQDLPKAFLEAKRITRPGGAVIFGMIDRSSSPGRSYEKKKEANSFYRLAHFHKVVEIRELLENAGYRDLSFSQTLVHPEEELMEEPMEGYGRGGV